MQSDHRAGYLGILKDEKELKLDSWILMTSTAKRKISKFLARKPPEFHWTTPRQSREEERAGGVEKELEVEKDKEETGGRVSYRAEGR